MHIFPRKNKQVPGAYYFGDYNDTPLSPFSVSVATFDESFTAEPKHYHQQVQKVYLVISGKGMIEVNGEQVELNPEQMIHVQPTEIHRIIRVLEAPFTFVVVTSAKVDDKVIVPD